MDYNEQKEDINMAKRRRNKKWVYGVVILVLLVVAGIVTYVVWNSYFNKSSDNNSEQELAEVEQKDEKKEETKKQEEVSESSESAEEIIENEREKEKESVVAYEGNNPNNAGGLTGVLTYAGVNGEYLMIRVNIDQYLTSGKCELGITQNGAVVYGETVNIVSAASTATCEGFNVPVSAIGSGDFEVEIRLNSGEKNGVIKGGVSI